MAIHNQLTDIPDISKPSRTMHSSTHYSELHSKLHSTLHLSSNSLSISHGRVPNALTISLERTIRLPDSTSTNHRPASYLPPSLGSFPLFSVDKYKHKLPLTMRRKGGLFIGMHEHEAVWVRFHAHEPFAVRVFVGGVNVVSGKIAAEEDTPSGFDQDAEKQDFLALPEQTCLDGTITARGEVRQFVAVRAGGGYSVEAQVGGKQEIGGLQFEITPVKRACPEMIVVKLGEKELEVKLKENGLSDKSHLEDLKQVIAHALDLPPLWLELDLEITGSCFAGMHGEMDFRDIYIAEGQIINVVDKVARAADLARQVEIKRLEEEELKKTISLTHTKAKAKKNGRPTDGMLPAIRSAICNQEQLRKWEIPHSSLFGNSDAKAPKPAFGQTSAGFGCSSSGGIFGGGNPNQNQNQVKKSNSFGGASSLFGQAPNPPQAGGLFGAAQPAQTHAPSLFGQAPNPPQAGGLFGATQPAQTHAPSLFGQAPNPPQAGGLFGATQTAQKGSSSLFATTATHPNPFETQESLEERRYNVWEASQITSELNSVLSNATQTSQGPVTINLTLPVTAPMPKPVPIIDTADKEMHLAPGARVAQTLRVSTMPHTLWDTTATMLFNIQILNSAALEEIVGIAPPEPITAKRYSEIGGVLFDLESGGDEGASGGNNSLVSVGEKDEGIFGRKTEGFWKKLRSAGKGEEVDGEERLEFRIARILREGDKKVEE